MSSGPPKRCSSVADRMMMGTAGPARSKPLGRLSVPNFPLAQVVIQHRDIRRVKHLVRFLNRGCGHALISVLPKDCATQQQIRRVVVPAAGPARRRQILRAPFCMSLLIDNSDASRLQGVTQCPLRVTHSLPTPPSLPQRGAALSPRAPGPAGAQNAATARSHCRLFIAWIARHDGLRFDVIWNAGLRRGYPRRRLPYSAPATPTWPARITRLPIMLEPARPTCAHSSVSSPTFEP